MIAAIPVPIVDACWNRIGVGGDRSCPELVEQIHCRNCPVFGSAARSFFDRPAPDGYLRDWADLLAKPADAGSVNSTGLLVFRLGVEWLAISILDAVEVTAPRPVHRVPHRTNAVFSGLVSLRGRLHPCVSLHGLLGVEGIGTEGDDPASSTRRLVLIRRDGESWAFLADEVGGVHHVGRDELGGVPSTLANPAGSFSRAVFAWGNRSVDVLDEARLVLAMRRMGT